MKQGPGLGSLFIFFFSGMSLHDITIYVTGLPDSVARNPYYTYVCLISKLNTMELKV